LGALHGCHSKYSSERCDGCDRFAVEFHGCVLPDVNVFLWLMIYRYTLSTNICVQSVTVWIRPELERDLWMSSFRSFPQAVFLSKRNSFSYLRASSKLVHQHNNPPTGSFTQYPRLDRAGKMLLLHPLLILALYFALNALMRTVLGAPPELDEAEQFAISTHYSFGYGPHPPLYQWLQVTAFNLLGVNYLAIAVLKNLILFGTYAMLYQLGWWITKDRMLATIGCVGLLFSTNFAWESQHDQSHTVSNTFLTVTAVYMVFRTWDRRTVGHYIVLGAIIGLWSLAKYNFLFPLSAVLVTFAVNQRTRSLYTHPAMVLTLLIAVAISYFHYLYIYENLAEATVKLSKLGIEDDGFIQTRFKGIQEFLRAFIGVHAVWIITAAALFFHWRKLSKTGETTEDTELTPAPSPAHADREAIFIRFCAITYALLLLFVLIAGTTRFRDHWMQPAAVFAPLLLSIYFRKWITWAFFRGIAVFTLVVMPVIMIAYLLNNLGIGTDKRDAAMPSPSALAKAIPNIKTAPITLVFADKRHQYRWFAAGHLRSYFSNLNLVFQPNTSKLQEREFWLLWRSKSPNLAQAENIYPNLKNAPATKFSKPVEIDHFRPDELGEFAGTKWWISRFVP